MTELRVTPEGMPSILLGGTKYPLFFSVFGVQRWAEHRSIDFQKALEDGWSGTDLSRDDLSKLLEIALSSGEARRHAFGGGEPRTVGDETIAQIFNVYSVVELASALAEAWNMLPEGEASPNPEAPRE